MNSDSLGYSMSALSDFSVTPRQQVTWLDGASILLSSVAFALFAGGSGILAGVALLILRYASTRLVTFALAHFLWIGVLPELSVVQLGVAEAGLLPLLVAALQTNTVQSQEWHPIGLIALFGGLLSVVAGLHTWLESNVIIAAVFTTTVLAITYVLHRYERVTLGLVTDSRTEVHR